jgi:hypothetical protein
MADLVAGIYDQLLHSAEHRIDGLKLRSILVQYAQQDLHTLFSGTPEEQDDAARQLVIGTVTEFTRGQILGAQTRTDLDSLMDNFAAKGGITPAALVYQFKFDSFANMAGVDPTPLYMSEDFFRERLEIPLP